MVTCKPWVMDKSATIAAIPMTTPKIVKAERSLRSLMALKE
jgi:hypothetical protein